MKNLVFYFIFGVSSLSLAAEVSGIPTGKFTFHHSYLINNQHFIYEPSFQTGSYFGLAIAESTNLYSTAEGLCATFGFQKMINVWTIGAPELPVVFVEGNGTGAEVTGTGRSTRYIWKLICE